MTIIIEYVFLNNLILDYIIIKVAALFGKIKLVKWKVFASCLLGATVAVLYPIVEIMWLQVLIRIFTGLCMAAIAFNYATFPQYIFSFLSFMLSTLVMGGGAYAILLIFSGGGGLSAENFPEFIVYIGLGIYGYIIKSIFVFSSKFLYINKLKYKYKIKLQTPENELNTYAYLDTGNVLVDPVSEDNVVIIGPTSFEKLYPSVEIIKVLTKCVTPQDIPGSHYIQCGGIAANGTMLILPLSNLFIEGKKIDNVALGLSFTKLSRSFGTDVLLNANCI